MPAASKRARKVRSAAEYDIVRSSTRLRPPKRSNGAYAWKLDEIRSARDAQLSGNFRLPALLAAAMRTDDALFVAYQNRLAPQRGLPVEVIAAGDSTLAKRIRFEADALFGPKGVGIVPGALESINGDLANHGVAFGTIVATVREDESRIDVEVHHWPIEFVRWDATCGGFVTQVQPGTVFDGANMFGAEVPIVHGDGQWIIFSKHEDKPWQQEACLLPAALVWSDHAFGRRDRSKHATAVSAEKWLGELPEGIATGGEHGTAMLDALEALSGDESVAAVFPHGSIAKRDVNNSSAWQNFKELVEGSGLSAQRIYNGQDATAGSQSSGPGVDAARLWGVRNDIVEGDLGALERGLYEGAITPWCALNFGDSSLAPWRKYRLPDPDESARRDAEAKLGAAFFVEMKAAKEVFGVLDPEWVAERAKAYGIKPPATAAAAPAATTPSPEPATDPAAPSPSGAPPAALRALPRR